MAVRRHKPTSPAQRQMSTADFSVLTKKAPEKSLLAENSKTGGRNSYGRITVRHIGGGNRRKYRIIDFRRRKDDVPGRTGHRRIRSGQADQGQLQAAGSDFLPDCW